MATVTMTSRFKKGAAVRLCAGTDTAGLHHDPSKTYPNTYEVLHIAVSTGSSQLHPQLVSFIDDQGVQTQLSGMYFTPVD